MPIHDDDWDAIDDRALPDAPFFCEENVWRLLVSALLPVPLEDRFVVFITNRHRAVAMWQQRAAAADPVVWDYHVVLLCKSNRGGVVVDVDCTAGAVSSLDAWVRASFRDFVPREAQPLFRVVDGPTFLRTFSSDRSHMRDASGALSKPEPPWPPPHQDSLGMNLMRFVDVDDDVAGFVCDLDDLLRFAAPS